MNIWSSIYADNVKTSKQCLGPIHGGGACCAPEKRFLERNLEWHEYKTHQGGNYQNFLRSGGMFLGHSLIIIK